MNSSTPLRDAIALALVMGSAGWVAGAHAQDANDASKDSGSAKTLDKIEVTGSRLKRADIEGAMPVVVIDRAKIDASGEVSVADYLRTTNFNSVGQFRPQSGSSAQAGAFADLRGLGSQRTLVLIDGHRAPKAPFAAGSGTDLNTIPLAAVERIEVLTDGASAIYGADAVGGVINIITRKDYNGAQVSVGHSNPKWGPTEDGSVLFGVSGDRGHLIGGFSYNRRSMIYTNSRPWGQTQGASTYGNNYISYNDNGTPATGILPVPGGCTNANFWINPANGRCVYDFNKTAADEASYRNKAFFVNGEYQINDSWSTFLSTTVSNSTSFGRYAPTPGVVHIDPDAAQNPNPGYNTYLYHRFAAAGNRDNKTDGTVYDINFGFRGSVSDSVDAEFGVRYNDYDYKEFGYNYIVGSLAEQAINDGDYNIYDPASTPVDVLNSIKATITRVSSFKTKEAYGNLTFNDLFQMGGGSSSLAVGAEFRQEDYSDQYDSLSEAGVILGSSGNSSGGKRRVNAFYAEWLLPITSNFDIDVAGRYEKYSDYGSNFAPKIALRWQPLDNLTFRGSVGKGFVAPTLDITTQKTAFSADTVYDPATCLDWGDYNAAGVARYGSAAAYCQATGGLNGVQVDSYREAAENLKAEKSTQYSLGVVWDAADWLNFTVDYYNIKIKDRIAFFSSQDIVDIDNGDSTKPMPGSPCSITRKTNIVNELGSPLDEIHNCYFNQGEVKTDGVDFAARTNFDLNAWGSLRNELMASWVHKYTIDGGDDQVMTQGFPGIRATLNNSWNYSDLTVGLNSHYIGPNGSGNNSTKHFTTYDVVVSYETPWNGKITLGVNNFTNRMPELISYDGRPFNFYLYDAYGRTPYLRYEQRF